MKHEELSDDIIEIYYHVYNEMGYGFLEVNYQKAMFHKLNDANLEATREAPIEVHFEDYLVGEYYADLIVENKVLLELKAKKKIVGDHEAQLLNYLKATNIEVGLLFNFGPEPEIKRKVYDNDRK